MLLIPLYRAADGSIVPAPVKTADKQPGFLLTQPTEFIKRHPRAVQISVLVLKTGLVVGAAAVGMSIPASAMQMADVTDSMLGGMMEATEHILADGVVGQATSTATTAVDATLPVVANLDAAIQIAEATDPALMGATAALGAGATIVKDDLMRMQLKAVSERVKDHMNRPGEWLDNLLADEKYRTVGRAEYMGFKSWLDRAHPGWQAQCGLAPTVQADGSVEWLPP